MGCPQPAHGARHTGGQAAAQGFGLDKVAGFVEVHVAVGRQRGALAKIEERGLTSHVAEHKAAAANISRLGVGDGQYKGGGYRGIDRIAARPDDHLGGCRTVSVRHGHGGLARVDVRGQTDKHQQAHGVQA